jgi:hypothetical protein
MLYRDCGWVTPGSYGRRNGARVGTGKSHVADSAFVGQCAWRISDCLGDKSLADVVAFSHFVSPCTRSSECSCISNANPGAVDFANSRPKVGMRHNAWRVTRGRRLPNPPGSTPYSRPTWIGRSRQLSSANVRNSSTAVMVSSSFSTCGM